MIASEIIISVLLILEANLQGTVQKISGIVPVSAHVSNFQRDSWPQYKS